MTTEKKCCKCNLDEKDKEYLKRENIPLPAHTCHQSQGKTKLVICPRAGCGMRYHCTDTAPPKNCCVCGTEIESQGEYTKDGRLIIDKPPFKEGDPYVVTSQGDDWESRFSQFLLGSYENGLQVPRTKEEWLGFIRQEREKARKEGFNQAEEELAVRCFDHEKQARMEGRKEACDYIAKGAVGIDKRDINDPMMEFDLHEFADLIDEAEKDTPTP